jgi:hypothetical protein
VHLAKEADEILKRTAQSVYRPGSHDVELVAHDRLMEPIEGWAFVTPVGAADPVIDEFSDDAPPSTLDSGRQLAPLVLYVLLACTDPKIERNRLACRFCHILCVL